jgi:hypothetical protein
MQSTNERYKSCQNPPLSIILLCQYEWNTGYNSLENVCLNGRRSELSFTGFEPTPDYYKINLIHLVLKVWYEKVFTLFQNKHRSGL